VRQEDLKEWKGVTVGDRVLHTSDAGFREGVPIERKVKSIRLVHWTPEEVARLGNPSPECFIEFEDGEVAGAYDRLEKISCG